MFNIIKPFLSQKTKNKIHILDDLVELKKYFDEDCLM